MPPLSRRRFLAITAAVTAMAPGHAQAAPLWHWRGVALGAAASIRLAHPEADRLIALAVAEIARLEAVFSLYRATSELSRLNEAGWLDAPSLDLVDCLGLCGRLHAATGGRFDPTVQPLWATHARAHAAGHAPTRRALAAAQARTGWDGVSVRPDRIALARPGMALTLNGIAQGFIADRVARLLQAEGLRGVLVDAGELRALGGHPDGGGWPVTLGDGGRRLALRDRALATSAPLGTTFDAGGTAGHILDPATGLPAAPRWQAVSVSAASAALADGLSTAFVLMERGAIDDALHRFPGTRIERLTPAAA